MGKNFKAGSKLSCQQNKLENESMTQLLHIDFCH